MLAIAIVIIRQTDEERHIDRMYLGLRQTDSDMLMSADHMALNDVLIASYRKTVFV